MHKRQDDSTKFFKMTAVQQVAAVKVVRRLKCFLFAQYKLIRLDSSWASAVVPLVVLISLRSSKKQRRFEH